MTTDDAIQSQLERVIGRMRSATEGTEYEGRLYLVGGVLRDRALGLPAPNDLDMVLEGDAVALAEMLHERGLSTHFPVLYPRFGTAMLHVDAGDGSGSMVEIVTARSESYQPDSRKPDVRQGTIEQDAYRRDFTINTLMENLHSGELLDITGRAMADLAAGVIRTPVDPTATFFDDPLRMLRAVRFAAALQFRIDQPTWEAVHAMADRLAPPAIAFERIREEFVKIVALPGPRAAAGMALLLEAGLLERFLPEMTPMVGCGQNEWHLYDVWVHTLKAIELLPDDAPVVTRLGLLWHDVGKPMTKTGDSRGVHFYGHQKVGADLTHTMMNRLKFSGDEIRDVTNLVALHMRLGDYRPTWPDGTVKRLIRDCGPYLDALFTIAKCDIGASNIAAGEVTDLDGLRKRIDTLNAISNVVKIESPLDGLEIMQVLGVGPGPHLRAAKEYLVSEVLDGRIAEGDKACATEAIQEWWRTQKDFTPP